MANLELEEYKNNDNAPIGYQAVQQVQENSDLKESLKELNDDSLDTNSNFSNIDMRSRVSSTEIPAMAKLHSLVALDFLPIEALNITRSKLRLNVSLSGQGRREMIEVAQGKREEKTFFSGMGSK